MGRSPFMILPSLRLRAATEVSRAESGRLQSWLVEQTGTPSVSRRFTGAARSASTRRVDEIGTQALLPSVHRRVGTVPKERK